MAKICSSGILDVVRKTIGGKGYFLMNDKYNDFIRVNQSMSPFKNNDSKSFSTSIDLANRLNKAINKDREIGKVFYPKQYSDMIGVAINPTDGQLATLNAEEEFEKREALAIVAQEKENNSPIEKLTDEELNNQALAEQEVSEFSNKYKGIPEDVNKSDDRDDQGEPHEQEELAYIDEQNTENEQITEQNNLSLTKIEETEEEKKLNEMINNGEIQTYCN